MAEEWVEHVADELGLSADIPTDALLDAARVAAHTVERKAAPLTTYMIGLAAAGRPDEAEAICRRVIELGRAWKDRPAS
jgi:hypothetical protein